MARSSRAMTIEQSREHISLSGGAACGVCDALEARIRASVQDFCFVHKRKHLHQRASWDADREFLLCNYPHGRKGNTIRNVEKHPDAPVERLRESYRVMALFISDLRPKSAM